MPDSLTANGLTLKTQAELIADLTAFLKGIYGINIDVTAGSPDANAINIYCQGATDIRTIIQQVFTSFDPDQAIGTILWQRVGINGIQVQGGTYTTTPVSVTTDRALNLYGLDQTTNPVYYVTDNAGNKWNLITTQSVSGPGTASYQFQAANTGAISVLPNTITVPGLIVLGVTAINNPTIIGTISGINQETDAALKIRRQQSVSLPSQGFQQGTQAALGNVPGVSYAKVYENYGQANPPYASPLNSIYAVISGSAAAADIANAIYVNRTEGCNMKGDQTYNVTQPDGTLFTIQWDIVVGIEVFIRFTATSINGTTPPNIAAIVAQLPTLFVPGIAAEININQLATFVQQIDPNTLVTNAGFSLSDTGPFTNTLTPAALNYQFQIASEDIIVLPIILNPTTSIVPHNTGTVQFAALGGHGTYVYSFGTNNSGGLIDSGTGAYTAGPTPSTDTILVTDDLGNTGTATVTVT
jgi:uncharacterized phage protein gp47/JayE